MKTPTWQHAATRALHADRRPDLDSDSALAPPIHYSATFRASSAQDFAEMASTPRALRYYTRYGNPGHARVAAVLAQLEAPKGQAEDYGALLTGSGMGAISTCLLSCLQAGDHVVAQRNHYMGTSKLLQDLLARFGVRCTLVDQTDVAAFARAIEAQTKLFVLETPANPTLALTDIRAITQLAQAHGITSLADNTLASPINQQPLALGVDYVVHSATKYLGGHHDLTAGVIVAHERNLDALWQTQIALGTTCSPMDSWLLLRGLRTLPLRVRQLNHNAQAIAEFLRQHPAVQTVHYPGLPSHPQHALAQQQMTGYGCVIAFILQAETAQIAYQRAQQFVSHLTLPQHAVSLGGVESLIVHAASMWDGSLGAEAGLAYGLHPGLLRFSVGLEDVADLQNDLSQALAAACPG